MRHTHYACGVADLAIRGTRPSRQLVRLILMARPSRQGRLPLFYCAVTSCLLTGYRHKSNRCFEQIVFVICTASTRCHRACQRRWHGAAHDIADNVGTIVLRCCALWWSQRWPARRPFFGLCSPSVLHVYVPMPTWTAPSGAIEATTLSPLLLAPVLVMWMMTCLLLKCTWKSQNTHARARSVSW